jgi:hypothetical protein
MNSGPVASARMAWVFALAVLAVACGSPGNGVTVGFWFEPTSYTSAVIGNITQPDLIIIEQVARDELRSAFNETNIILSDRRDSRYRVAVTQAVQDNRVKRQMSVAGASRAMRGFGGSGSVSLSFAAGAAVAYAPAGASRNEIVDAIGRGIGRVAVHEFTHQFLPHVPIHDSRDPATFEFGAANRPEQYYGSLHWGFAGPLLRARFGG